MQISRLVTDVLQAVSDTCWKMNNTKESKLVILAMLRYFWDLEIKDHL